MAEEEEKTPKIAKARYWWAVLYQENMRPDWRETIDDLLQLPYAYCEHTADKDSRSEHRKDHVHIIVAKSNTTSYKHIMEVFNLLSAPGKKA
ncbi:MAG: Rep family protein, partial [Collinsella sp.]